MGLLTELAPSTARAPSLPKARLSDTSSVRAALNALWLSGLRASPVSRLREPATWDQAATAFQALWEALLLHPGL